MLCRLHLNIRKNLKNKQKWKTTWNNRGRCIFLIHLKYILQSLGFVTQKVELNTHVLWNQALEEPTSDFFAVFRGTGSEF